MEKMFQVVSLETGYNDLQVLWGVDIDIGEKEIVCLIGSNGAGKTSLLRCISGLLPIRKGDILYRGRSMAGETPDRILSSGIAHVPERRRLFSAMNVRNNLLMGAYLRRDKEIENDLEYVFGLFPILRKRVKQDAGTLSGGEQQMCAIARGIMSRPTLLLIDELSLGLAPLVVEQLSGALLNVNREGISILLVEQDVMTALELAQRGFVLESGRISIQGPAVDLARNAVVKSAYIGI